MSRDWLDKDFYATLGVSKDASTEDIKKAYKKLARENHPDLNPGDTEAEKKFKEISEASSVLGDERKRQEYDQVRSMGASGFGGFGGQGFNVDDFGDLFGNLGDIFGFGGSGGRRKGQTYQTNINISFDEAAKGVETVIPLRKKLLVRLVKAPELIKEKRFIDVTFAMEVDKLPPIKVFFLLHKLVLPVRVKGMLLIKYVKHVGVLAP